MLKTGHPSVLPFSMGAQGEPMIDSDSRHPADCALCQAGMRPDPKRPGKHINPETGIWPISEWGPECGRGLPRERFTRRPKTRGKDEL